MWECVNCREQLADKYRHCWNCGTSRPGAKDESSPGSPAKIKLKLAPVEKIPVKVEAPPPKKEAPPAEKPAFEEKIPPAESAPFGSSFYREAKPPSKLGAAIPVLLWLAATVSIAVFSYYSYQKTKSFENRLAADSARLSGETSRFSFAPNAPREKKATIKAKVLPLNAATGALDGLYNFLPEDLRPASADEVKTILWLDCKQREAGRYEEDDSIAYRDICNAYLVDRESAKVVKVQDFLGELPPLKKQWSGNYASGKVLPEALIAYLRENQPADERAPARFATDSPDHHIWFKSELLYAIVLLALLGAAGLGWIVFKIKSMF